MKYKIKFTQSVSGIQEAECIIEAEDSEQAIQKMLDRDFTSYLVTKQRLDYETDSESIRSVTRVKEY